MNLTLLIDGNWLAISRMSIFANQFKKSSPDIIKSSAAEDFKILLARSISAILNRFIDIDNIILISDGGSWRKSLTIPKCLEVTYKGNRGDDMGELDFDIIFKSFNEFISNINSKEFFDTYIEVPEITERYIELNSLMRMNIENDK